MAIIAAWASALITDRHTDSDLLITLVSTLGGTAGFLSMALGLYLLLHLKEYANGNRNCKQDTSSIMKSYFDGLIATYAFRIPFQFLLQKLGVAPTVAAPVAQVVSGQIGNVVRIYRNYQRNIFAVQHPPKKSDNSTEISND